MVYKDNLNFLGVLTLYSFIFFILTFFFFKNLFYFNSRNIIIFISLFLLLFLIISILFSQYTNFQIFDLFYDINRILFGIFIIGNVLEIIMISLISFNFFEFQFYFIYILFILILFFSSLAFYYGNHFPVKIIKLNSSKISNFYKFIHLSDVHYQGVLGKRNLNKIEEKILLHNPDFILITGDLFDIPKNVNENNLNIFQKIKCPIYYVRGNHETEFLSSKISFEKLNLIFLKDEIKIFNEIEIIGLDDCNKKKVNAKLININPNLDLFSILLFHRPYGYKLASEKKFDLMLTGHLHNGQIVPFNLVLKLIFKKVKGLFKIKDMNLYIHPGTWTCLIPFRLGTKNEITLFEISPKK